MQTLQNHFLLAMPSLTDAYFQRSLVYLCEHSSEGAMGLVVNIPVDMSLDAMLTKLNLNPPATAEMKQPVLQGGPVHGDRGFVLHSFRPGFNSTLQVSDEMMVTTSKDILETLGTDEAPDHWLVALGYAGWSAGQLEQELVDGAWLLNGSFNWTRSASVNNEENLLVTDDAVLIGAYRREFEELWGRYAPR